MGAPRRTSCLRGSCSQTVWALLALPVLPTRVTQRRCSARIQGVPAQWNVPSRLAAPALGLFLLCLSPSLEKGGWKLHKTPWCHLPVTSDPTSSVPVPPPPPFAATRIPPLPTPSSHCSLTGTRSRAPSPWDPLLQVVEVQQVGRALDSSGGASLYLHHRKGHNNTLSIWQTMKAAAANTSEVPVRVGGGHGVPAPC